MKDAQQTLDVMSQDLDEVNKLLGQYGDMLEKELGKGARKTIEKARVGLVEKKVWVERDGKRYQTTVYVRPDPSHHKPGTAVLTRAGVIARKNVSIDEARETLFDKVNVTFRRKLGNEFVEAQLQDALSPFTGEAMRRILRGVNKIMILPTMEKVNAILKNRSVNACAFYSPGAKKVVVASGHTVGHVLTHEFTHAIDKSNLGYKYSDMASWKVIWRDEIEIRNRLNREYSQTNPQEGLACAIEYAQMEGIPALRKTSPVIYNFLVKMKILKEA